MRLPILAAPVLLGLLLTGCAKHEEKEEEPVLPVQVSAAETGAIERIIHGEGVLRALDQSAVTSKISAPVSKFYVNRGDSVTHGQLLATLESKDLTAAVTDAKGAYEQAAAAYRNTSSATVPNELVKAQSDVESTRQQLAAATKLLESREQLFREGALARRQVDEAAVAHAQAKSAYDTARKAVESLQSVGRLEEVKVAAGAMESAKGKYDAAIAQLSYTEIRSPIAGVVADRPAFAGEMAAPGTPLLTIVDVSSVVARVNIPQADAAWVKVGQTAQLTSSDGATETAGRVTVVSPAVDPQSTTVEIWIQAPNPGWRLRPGGAVRAAIHAGSVANAVIVPVEALLPSDEGGAAVYVVTSDSIAHQRKVKVGVRHETSAQILGGVAAGDQIVVEGGVGLTDGAKVKVEKPQGAKPEEAK